MRIPRSPPEVTAPNQGAQERKDRKGNKLRGARGLRVSLLPVGCPHHGPGGRMILMSQALCIVLPHQHPSMPIMACTSGSSAPPELLANLVPRSPPSPLSLPLCCEHRMGPEEVTARAKREGQNQLKAAGSKSNCSLPWAV